MDTRAEEASTRRAIVAGSIGNFVEWYDFAIYAYLAPIIATLFFPSQDRVASLLATFAVFGVGFVMRPLGALVFGHYGDKVGRRNTLAAAVILMALATFVIGITPTYASIGILAPILLVVARLAQGFSAGGEWGGSASFLVEYAPEGRRGFVGSWQQFTVGGGFLAGAAVGALLTTAVSEATVNAYAWRIPFLLGMAAGLVGLYLRLRLDETPNFKTVERTNSVAAAPLAETIRNERTGILMTFGLVILPTLAFYVFLTYVPTYLSEVVGLSLSEALTSNVIGAAFFVALVPFMGALSDRVGRKPVLIASAVGWVILTYPAFLLLSQGDFLLAVLGQLMMGLLLSGWSGPGPATVVELFPTRVRYSALSLGYNLSVVTFGGTAPFIATYLVLSTGSNLAPAFYVIVAAVIWLVVLLRLKETYRAPLRDF